MSMRIDPLSFPKGVKYFCELCHQTAHLRCAKCNVTYYCCKEHQKIDWDAIHQDICKKLMRLRKPGVVKVFKVEREKAERARTQEILALGQFAREACLRYMYEGDKDILAKAAAVQYLHFLEVVYHSDSVEMVRPYLLLGESFIKLGKLKEAKEYLAVAQWNVLRSGATPSIKSALHRSLAIHYAADQKPRMALRALAEDVYQSSVEYGPDSIQTAGGYFLMANIFFNIRKRLVADSLYRQVTEAYYHHLLKILKYRFRPSLIPVGVGPGVIYDDDPVVPEMDEMDKPEARFVLYTIFQLREHQVRCPHKEMQLICLTYGIFMLLYGSLYQALEMGKKAYKWSQLEPDTKLTKHTMQFMALIKKLVTG